MRAAHFVILEQHFFELLHLWRDLREPGSDCFFLDAFDAMDGGERISFGQQREALDDRLLVVLFAVENRAFGGGHDLFAGRALPALATFACEPELA